jgi:hypothetical protein
MPNAIRSSTMLNAMRSKALRSSTAQSHVRQSHANHALQYVLSVDIQTAIAVFQPPITSLLIMI